ncbi:MAG: helicase-associated domain-containing protein, partial [Anaerolineae bacterium]|nr:helicase-associated domain-containing protein [Anaerolineae bacterium]
NPLHAARELAEQLLAPTSLALALAELPDEAREALHTLQRAGGWMESPRFTRRFGTVRPMGPRRMQRERPWETPANATEALYYRGLIFQGFHRVDEHMVEVFYIPQDILPLLPPPPPSPAPPALPPSGPPTHRLSAVTALVEDVFSLLVYVYRHAVPLEDEDRPSAAQRSALLDALTMPQPHAGPPSHSREDRLVFLLHLCRVAGLIIPHHNRLMLQRENARRWLQSTPAERFATLQRAWRDDPTWCDLRDVPTLKLPTSDWHSDPLPARRVVLRMLSRCSPGTWYRIDDLIAAIKAYEPDFQRPDGDYSVWYLHDRDGRPLLGFEHWDDVEGALIRHLITQPLFWLGVVELGCAAGAESPTTFCVTHWAATLLEQAPPSEEAAPDVPAFVVGEDFTVRVASHACLYERFHLARFAKLVKREGGVTIYRLSPDGVRQLVHQGVRAEQLMRFLMRISDGQAPRRVLETVKRWCGGTTAHLERVLVLRLADAAQLAQLRRDPVARAWLGEQIGPTSVLVPLIYEARLRRWLREHGYL